MSGTLPKSPSEGDLTSKSAEFSHQTLDRKKSLSRAGSFLPLGTNKFYLNPDLKKGAFASSNIRIVWKSNTYGDLSNLNKVLDLPHVPKTSPSPVTPKVGPTDHVFSEYFDPLAVHKRENVESSEEEDSDSKSLSSSFHRTVDRKRLDTEIEDMPSVKVLKSLFEKSKGEKVEDIPPYTRASKRSKPNLEENIITLTDEPKDLDTGTDKTKKITHGTKENVKKLSLIIINDNEKSLPKENNEDKEQPAGNYVNKSEKIQATKTRGKPNSREMNIEADHIRKVKDLLSIFKSMEPKKEVHSSATDTSTEKVLPEIRDTNVERDIEFVDNDKVKSISSEKRISIEVLHGNDNAKIKEDSTTTKNAKLDAQDLESKYISEEPIDTSSTSVFDLKRKWETMVIRKENSSKNVESTDKALKTDKTEDMAKAHSGKKPVTEKGNKISTENISQSKIVIETKEAITEKGNINIDKEEMGKTEQTVKIVSTKKQTGEKGKVTIEENVLEKQIHSKRELQKAYSDSVYNTGISQSIIMSERDDKLKTSVKDLASIFEFKKIWETKSAPVTPAATSTPIKTFDYDIPISKTKNTHDTYSSPSVEEIHKKLKPDVPKEQESKIKKSSKEEISILSSASVVFTKDDKKSTSNLQNLKQRYSSESHLSSNFNKTQHNYNVTNATPTQGNVNVGVSEAAPLEKMKRIKSESHFSNKFIANDIQVTTGEKHKESSKISIQESSTTNYRTMLKSVEKEVSRGVVESQSSVVHKTEKVKKDVKQKEVESQPPIVHMTEKVKMDVKQKEVESQPSIVQKTDKVGKETNEQKPSLSSTEQMDKTPSESKASHSKEMSLASLERKASVTKMKTMYERQSSVPEIEKPQKETPSTKIQESHSVSSLKTQITNSSSKETKIASMSTIVQESNEISKKDDVAFKFNNIAVNTNPEVVDHKSTTSNKMEKKKTKIEELVESFVKSEGLSKYLEELPDKNISPLSPKESKDFKSQDKGEKTEISSSEELKKVSKKSTSSLSSSNDKKSVEVNNTTLVVRSGSRELRPDELKYFQDMMSSNKNNRTQMRERSNSIDSSSPTSTLPKNKFSRSKLRSSSRQFRDLHSDELKYFGSKINDRHSKKLLTSSTDVTLRQEVLERALLASSLEENEREE